MPRWLSSQKMETVKVRVWTEPLRPVPILTTSVFVLRRPYFLRIQYVRPLPLQYRSTTHSPPCPQAMLLRESLGISADASNKAFPSAEVDAFLARRLEKVPYNFLNNDHKNNTKHFLLAVDPSGGGSSAFAITSILQDGLGRLVVSTTHLFNSICSVPSAPSAPPAPVGP